METKTKIGEWGSQKKMQLDVGNEPYLSQQYLIHFDMIFVECSP